MKRAILFVSVAWVFFMMVNSSGAAPYKLSDVTIVVKKDAADLVKLAANEIRGYVYRLTGNWPPLVHQPPGDEKMGKPYIVLRTGEEAPVSSEGIDPAQNFALYPIKNIQMVHGATDVATLWAAYHLIEGWGVGFYLGGDILPPAGADLKVEMADSKFSPVLAIRGNLPWFNFLNSPTTWNPQDYKTFFSQMAKQKANLINFHAYDHEPFCGYDITDQQVTMGGPLMTTISEHRWWSPHAVSTKDHLFGTDLFFDRGEWGCEVGIDMAWTFSPGAATRLQQDMMAEALKYARSRGIRTCLGFEVSGDPLDEKVREGLRKRMTHVLEKYPLDYLGIWQAEHLGVRGAGGKRENDKAPDAEELWSTFSYLKSIKHQAEGVRMARHIRFAHQLIKEVAPHVKMVVSGWGGDQHMKFTDYYEGLDRVVPKDIIFAALDNIDPRSADHVSEVYGKVAPGRQCWPIPWFESDGGHSRIDQTGPQTNVTAFEPLLKNIVKKKCYGALGIHWRTRNVEDVAGYLYRFAWNPKLTAEEYFKHYARDHYGPSVAEDMAQKHLRLEEFGPQYVGARGTVECGSKKFWWFSGRANDPLVSYGPNLAGTVPDISRFKELEAMSTDFLTRSFQAAEAGARDYAIQYHDLARTIDWLVKRARVGMMIWGEKAPILRLLQGAEALYEQGRIEEARTRVNNILVELDHMNFREALQSLASTCRTRGELGMLATANARYGRYYATLLYRIERILGEPLPEDRGSGRWLGGEVLTVFPVPNQVTVKDTISFDAVLLPFQKNIPFQIELTDLNEPAQEKKVLKLQRLGGAYHRAVFFPPGPGAWAWKLVPMTDYQRPRGSVPFANGIITVSS